MGGPAKSKAIAEYKAAGKGFYGLEDPGPDTDLLKELGINIPRFSMRYIMSAAAETPPVGDCVADCAGCKNVQASCMTNNTSTDSGEDMTASGTDPSSPTDDETARARADLTCAATARQRCAPRAPLRPNDASSRKRREREPGLRPCYNPFTDEASVYGRLEPFSPPAKWMADLSRSLCVARPVSKAEAARNADAKAALKKEWGRLQEIDTWLEDQVMEF